MAKVGPGDLLAGGASGAKATYRMPSSYVDPVIQEDFGKLGESEFRVKYGVSPASYSKLREDPSGLKDLVRFNFKLNPDEEAAFEDDKLRKPMQVTDKRKFEVDGNRKPKPAFKGQALGTHLIIELDEVVEKTQGGIVLADTAKELPTTGTVVSVGGKVCEVLNDTVSKGDRIMIPRYSASAIQIHGTPYTWIAAEDVIVRL